MSCSNGRPTDEELALLPESQEINGGRTRRGFWSFLIVISVGFGLGCVALYTIGRDIWLSTQDSQSLDLYTLNFLAIGDWGRNGMYNQSEVATQMGVVGSKLDIEFVISLGDNFYDTGLTGVNDDKFFTSFTNVYTAPSLQKTWYTVLGNHDYMGDALAQLNVAMVNRDPRWICHREFQLTRPLCSPSHSGPCDSNVEFFFIDTSPFIDEYWMPSNQTFDWRGLAPRAEQLQTQLQNLEKALHISKATWKIVVGHHTIYSFGHHGNSKELIQQVLPILEANGVDLYLNGHDHCLEHIKRDDSQLHFVTSGAGSRAWQGIQSNDGEFNGMQFAYDGQGFISMSVAPRTLQIDFYDAFGQVLYTLRLSKHLSSNQIV